MTRPPVVRRAKEVSGAIRRAIGAALLGSLAALVPTSSPAEDRATAGFRSGTAPVALIELYTSEGCSSCPRADAWLSQLKESPRLWSVFVPVAFHVHYWNSPAWRDPWSQAAFTERQKRVSAAWTPSRVYTPAMAAHGREWGNWASLKEPPPLGGDVGVLAVRPIGGRRRWSAAFVPRSAATGPLRLHAACLGFDLTSRVTGGENAGRTLSHDFVVLGYGDLPMPAAGGRWSAEFTEPAAATGTTARALAVWVERDGRPIQATGGWLEDRKGGP